jgi:hypothetical protein
MAKTFSVFNINNIGKGVISNKHPQGTPVNAAA